MTTPLVSVVIPAFNAARWIDRTIASALAQTHRALEVIVVDDGSSDDTADLVARVAAQEARVRLIRQPNGGVARARNAGIDAAHGAFIAPLDADDLWAPDKIAMQVAALDAAGPSAALAYCWFRRIDEADQLTGASSYPRVEGRVYHRHLLWNFISNGSSPLVRAEAARNVRYDPALRDAGNQGCEDYLFQLGIARRHAFVCVPRFLVGYRVVPGSMMQSGERMLRSHLQMFGIAAADAPPSARPILRRRRGETALTLAGHLARRGDGRAAGALLAALRDDPAAPLRSLTRRVRPAAGETHRTTGEPFATLPTDRIDDDWATRLPAALLARLARLDAAMD